MVGRPCVQLARVQVVRRGEVNRQTRLMLDEQEDEVGDGALDVGGGDEDSASGPFFEWKACNRAKSASK